jgi:hypothetical protein
MISIFQEEEGGLRDRLRDAYFAEWTRFEPPDRPAASAATSSSDGAWAMPLCGIHNLLKL